MKLTIDTDTILFKLLKANNELSATLSGGIYTGDDGRPDNSEKEDIVVNTIDLSQESLPQLGTSNVNIHVPDMTISINNTQQKKTNRTRLKELSEIVMTILRTAKIEGLALVVTNQVTLAEPEISQHFVNIRINWYIH